LSGIQLKLGALLKASSVVKIFRGGRAGPAETAKAKPTRGDSRHHIEQDLFTVG
jgi:hypothetical protein